MEHYTQLHDDDTHRHEHDASTFHGDLETEWHQHLCSWALFWGHPPERERILRNRLLPLHLIVAATVSYALLSAYLLYVALAFILMAILMELAVKIGFYLVPFCAWVLWLAFGVVLIFMLYLGLAFLVGYGRDDVAGGFKSCASFVLLVLSINYAAATLAPELCDVSDLCTAGRMAFSSFAAAAVPASDEVAVGGFASNSSNSSTERTSAVAAVVASGVRWRDLLIPGALAPDTWASLLERVYNKSVEHDVEEQMYNKSVEHDVEEQTYFQLLFWVDIVAAFAVVAVVAVLLIRRHDQQIYEFAKRLLLICAFIMLLMHGHGDSIARVVVALHCIELVLLRCSPTWYHSVKHEADKLLVLHSDPILVSLVGQQRPVLHVVLRACTLWEPIRGQPVVPFVAAWPTFFAWSSYYVFVLGITTNLGTIKSLRQCFPSNWLEMVDLIHAQLNLPGNHLGEDAISQMQRTSNNRQSLRRNALFAQLTSGRWMHLLIGSADDAAVRLLAFDWLCRLPVSWKDVHKAMQSLEHDDTPDLDDLHHFAHPSSKMVRHLHESFGIPSIRDVLGRSQDVMKEEERDKCLQHLSQELITREEQYHLDVMVSRGIFRWTPINAMDVLGVTRVALARSRANDLAPGLSAVKLRAAVKYLVTNDGTSAEAIADANQCMVAAASELIATLRDVHLQFPPPRERLDRIANTLSEIEATDGELVSVVADTRDAVRKARLRLDHQEKGSANTFTFLLASKLRECSGSGLNLTSSDGRSLASASDDVQPMRYQDLQSSFPDWFEDCELTLEGACRGAYTSQYLAISHRWEKPKVPDETGVQLTEICSFLRRPENAGITHVWYDFWCLPQGRRSRYEDRLFKRSLRNVNLLYLGCRVLLLVDLTYQSRFWTQFEAWLSTQAGSGSGLVPARQESRRCSHVAIHNADPKTGDLILKLWADKAVSQVVDILSKPDVTVTNQSDKVDQLKKIQKLNDLVKALGSSTCAAAAAAAPGRQGQAA